MNRHMEGSRTPVTWARQSGICAAVVAFTAWISLSASAAESHSTPSRHEGEEYQPYKPTARHSYEDVDHWKAVFDAPGRDHWQRPALAVAALRLEPGMWVADLGAGTGYFMSYLSAAVGKTGTVLAVEPEPKLLAYLRERAEKIGADNVVPVLASLDTPRIPPGTVHLILIVNTFHHIDDRLNYFQRLQGALKPGGRIAIIDWHKRPTPEGPPVAHRIAREHVVEEMTAAGYRLIEESDILPYQYFLIFLVK